MLVSADTNLTRARWRHKNKTSTRPLSSPNYLRNLRRARRQKCYNLMRNYHQPPSCRPAKTWWSWTAHFLCSLSSECCSVCFLIFVCFRRRKKVQEPVTARFRWSLNSRWWICSARHIAGPGGNVVTSARLMSAMEGVPSGVTNQELGVVCSLEIAIWSPATRRRVLRMPSSSPLDHYFQWRYAFYKITKFLTISFKPSLL